jgi:hypothetical protein
MDQDAGCEGESQHIVWVTANPEYELLLRLMDGMHADAR